MSTTTVENQDSWTAESRAEIIEKICSQLERTHEDRAALLCSFARAFFAKAPRPVLEQRSVEELVALTVGAFEFLDRAGARQPVVEVTEPASEGWERPVTILRAQVGDRPFVVDTIREFLSAHNLPLQSHIYPILGIQRDDSGHITEIGSPGIGERWAYTHCEIPEIEDEERKAEIQAELHSRLADTIAATDDFRAMLGQLSNTVEMVEGYREQVPERAEELQEVEDFLRWLHDENFVFLGYRAYDIEEHDGEKVVKVEPGSGLGILRDEGDSMWAGGVPLPELSDELRRRVIEGPALITSKTNAESPVHRRARMDYIGVKKLSQDGEVIGERRFLGLFTSKAYADHADSIPILRRKLENILSSSAAVPGSHDYKEIITIFNSMPKEELFQASVSELEREVHTVLNLLFTDQVQVTLRRDPLGRGVGVMVILPRGRFSGEVRHRIQDALLRRFGGEILNYHLAMSAGDQARLHFHVNAPSDALDRVEADDIVADIHQIIRSWDDRLSDALTDLHGAAESAQLLATYGGAFTDEYRAATRPEVAAQDISEIVRLLEKGQAVGITLREPRTRGQEAPRDITILKLFLMGGRLVLSDFMPILDNAGIRVIEVTPFEIFGDDLPGVMIYSFEVQDPSGTAIPEDRALHLAEALLAIRDGQAADDPFNALIIRAGLRWREVDILRAYANYAFQSGVIPARLAAARALSAHPELARLLVEYFRARFDPAGLLAQPDSVKDRGTSALRAAINGGLDAVTTLADDRAIRRMATLIEATVRTNFFALGGVEPTRTSGGAPYISLKIRSNDVEELRKNRLLFEIFVFSSRMEGVHLRGAPVSRGGIRWSDRPDDFRTEILGLVTTQIVKNAVIVPGGSKGGFITKRQHADRQEMMDEAAEQYRTLMRGMLDITDNIVDGEVVPPEDVVRYDPDDPYLVVAADKGTAHLSDVANGVAAEYGFWLGDAFASGGSNGYDHKKEGITARGAWESVKRHFWEMGKDIQAEPFTVAGIGDMSGDVFGNGMLLSEQIRLIAAFDHRHIFIDPEPDPATSFAERKRLFELGRSSWEDYDRSVMSEGGFIVPRSAKEVAITPQAREALGLDETVESLDGESLVRAVLRSPAELLWNGGIGTYVKAAEETNAEVGDPANDPVRVNAAELRCRVIGEGGNLGLTQSARIAFARNGGRINTDALDNSAGVDMSDHEVNLKILLGPLVRSGTLGEDARNELLESMTDEVSRLVLNNNFHQSLAVSLDLQRSRIALEDFTALISSLERDRLLNRSAEGIPPSEILAEYSAEGRGLTRPTLCVLLAYAKLHAKSALLASALPDDPATAPYLRGYFPAKAVEAAGAELLTEHRLRREIITTELVNDLVNLMGAGFLDRLARETGRTLPEVVAAWTIASRISGAPEIRADLEHLEEDYDAETVYRWLFGLARTLERTTRWTLNNVDLAAPFVEVTDGLVAGLSTLRGEFGRVVAGEDRTLFESRIAELEEIGVTGALAQRIITLRFLPQLLDILRIGRELETDPLETATAYYVVSDRLGINWLNHAVRAAATEELWEKRLVQELVGDLQKAQRGITRNVLQCRDDYDTIAECLEVYDKGRAHESRRFTEILEELKAGDQPSLAAVAVAVRSLVDLAAF